MGLLTLFGIALAAGAMVLYAGAYDVAATEQHVRPTFWLLETGLRQSVQRRARGIEVPPLDSQPAIERGFRCFQSHCVQCHGAPGVAPDAFAKGLLPVPSSLSQAARDWRPAELYWITRHGIKMTGMPAWEFRLEDGALWAIVAYLNRLPELTPADYRRWDETIARSDCARAPTDPRDRGDAARGRTALLQYGCTACHVIPGVVGPASVTGPPLTGMAKRKYIAGTLPNTGDNMVGWLMSPQAARPSTAMPDMGVTAAHARDIAAYLAELQ